MKNLYVPNYKDCSYDSKNIWLLGKIPQKYKSESNFWNFTKVGIKVLKSKCCKLYLMVNFLEKYPKFTKNGTAAEFRKHLLDLLIECT